MRIGRYSIRFSDFEPLPWSRCDQRYDDRGIGTVYHSSGWLCFIVRWKESFYQYDN